MSALRFEIADPLDPPVAALVAAHHAASSLHYAAEDCHALDGVAMAEAGVLLHALRDREAVLGIGGLKPFGTGSVELKSMFVSETARGRGVARTLLEHLLAVAKAAGYDAIFLEAGRSDDYAAPARALYDRAGFVECPPFGPYVARAASLFLTRAV